jgi:peptidoglycan-N-acetylglucosamine deacetylase
MATPGENSLRRPPSRTLGLDRCQIPCGGDPADVPPQDNRRRGNRSETTVTRGEHFAGHSRLSRRALLGGGTALVASLLAGLDWRGGAGSGATGHSGLAGYHLGQARPLPEPPPSTTEASLPTPTLAPPPAATTTTTVASPIPGATITPVAARSRPVFYLHDYLPNAPANAVALTIDDGPDLPWTPQVLAVLAEYNVKATFSLVGIHVSREPGLVRQILAAGHGVCNHSMTHPEPFASLPQATIDAEIAGGLEAIHTATGRVATLFRSPGGDWSPAVFAAIARWGMTPIDWDVDPRDWNRPGSGYITRKLLAARPGDILLCHDGGGNRSETVTALRAVLPALLARGLRFVTL